MYLYEFEARLVYKESPRSELYNGTVSKVKKEVFWRNVTCHSNYTVHTQHLFTLGKIVKISKDLKSNFILQGYCSETLENNHIIKWGKKKTGQNRKTAPTHKRYMYYFVVFIFCFCVCIPDKHIYNLQR